MNLATLAGNFRPGAKRRPRTRKASRVVQPTGVERSFAEDEIIVSKTDPKGIITYANDVFIRLAGFSELELIGAPHSVIRHPDMPRCIFKLLWDTVQAKREIFAYVINMSKNGDHYWVFAHVTPSFDDASNIVGYHSNRRKPDPAVVETIAGVYQGLLAEEQRHGDRRAGLAASTEMLGQFLAEKGMPYDEFIFSLQS